LASKAKDNATKLLAQKASRAPRATGSVMQPMTPARRPQKANKSGIAGKKQSKK